MEETRDQDCAGEVEDEASCGLQGEDPRAETQEEGGEAVQGGEDLCFPEKGVSDVDVWVCGVEVGRCGGIWDGIGVQMLVGGSDTYPGVMLDGLWDYGIDEQ